jgi:hypothetical protein
MPNRNGFWSVTEMEQALALRAGGMTERDICLALFNGDTNPANLANVRSTLTAIDEEDAANRSGVEGRLPENFERSGARR